MALSTTSLTATVAGGETATTGLATSALSLAYSYAPTAFADGTGASQAQKVATVSGATIDSTGTSYDLTAMAGGINASTVNFGAVKLLVIENTGSVNLLVGNGTNPWTGLCSSGTATLNVRPGGALIVCAPDATGLVTSGSDKVIKLATASSTTTVKIVVVGEGS